MIKVRAIPLIAVLMLVESCSEVSQWEVDVSDIDLEIKVQRFEHDLVDYAKPKKEQSSIDMQKKYGTFFQRFVEDILYLGSINDPFIQRNISAFTTDPDIKQLYNECEEQFTDMEYDQQAFTEAFKRYRYHFPNKVIPDIVTFISGFNYAVVATDSTLGVGLDMFLGADNEFYVRLAYPLYKKRLLTKERLVIDAVKGWLKSEFEMAAPNSNTLLDQMIYEGKIMLAMDALFPHVADSIKIGFASSQDAWCNENEFQMWGFMVDQKLLYSTDQMLAVKFIGEGPFTAGFSQESPAQTGIWIGWQIMRAYKERHKSMTLAEIMAEKDAKKIFLNSRYKPR